MIDRSPYGRRVASDAIRFERLLESSVDRVWHALTTAEGLEPWLGAAVVDLRVGGTFTVRLAPDVVMDGRVLACEPPRRLVLAWHEHEDGVALKHGSRDDDTSELAFTLAAEGTGTRLVLEHRLIRGGEVMSSFGAGWHLFMDALNETLLGAPRPAIGPGYEILHPQYVSRFAEASDESP